MKQYITKEQLNELQGEPFLKLYHWALDRDYCSLVYKELPEDWNPTTGTEISFYSRPDRLPILSIGQMIEYLDFYGSHNDWWRIEREDSNIPWYIDFTKMGSNPSREHYHEELCDALWEAVKDILNKEQ